LVLLELVVLSVEPGVVLVELELELVFELSSELGLVEVSLVEPVVALLEGAATELLSDGAAREPLLGEVLGVAALLLESVVDGVVVVVLCVSVDVVVPLLPLIPALPLPELPLEPEPPL
jgi:hypothetical protein